MSNINRITAPLWDLQTFFLFEDFTGDQTDLFWLDTVTDSGTVTYDDEASGVALLDPSDGTVADNDEAYLASANEVFLVAAGKPLYFKTRISYQEQNTDDANIMVGFMSASQAANLIVDDGAGPRTSGNYFVVEKRDGETAWRLSTRNGSNATSTLSTATAGVANDLTSWQEIEIFVFDWDTTTVKCSAKVDGAWLKDSNYQTQIISHQRLIASSTEMHAMVGVKNGGANNELLYVDYIYAAQARRG